MSAMRKGIAEHMRRSLDTSAHVTSSIEVDMTKIAALRQKLKKDWAGSYGVNPTFLAFVARAVVDTLQGLSVDQRRDPRRLDRHPELRQPRIRGRARGRQGPHRPGRPQRRDAEPPRDGEGDRRHRRAGADKQLLPDDVQGGTFTITNPGGYGTFHGTPVISQPQAAILGTYAVVKRPWVVEDEDGQDAIAIRSMMNLTLTYDHRLVDGALAGRFLRDLRERLQSWDESTE